jgi:hypothetical protein
MSAQEYRSSIGWNAGVLLMTSVNDGASSGGESVDLKPDMTWSIGAHYDQWLWNGQVGVRGYGAIARPTIQWANGDREIYVYSVDLGLILRPIPPNPRLAVSPFVTGGIGVIYWSLGDGPVTSFPSAGASYPGTEEFQLMAVGGAGLDFITPWRWGEGPLVVRLEARDQIQLTSPFDPLDAEESAFGMIHHLRLNLGFHTGIGLLGGN